MSAPKDEQLGLVETVVAESATGGRVAASCIETEELAQLIAGELAPERVEAILVHVDRCAVCAEVMANLGQLEASQPGQPGAGQSETSPRSVGRYRLDRVLGSGAMGIVYDAWDPQLRRRVALKLVRPENTDPESHARMLREARALARISHPNVVAVYDVSEHAGRICVATELVDGDTLAVWQLGRSPAAIVDAWLQAARGLAAAHAGGIVHRDVKPANVLVGRDGRVRVGDFGIARMGGEATGPDAPRDPSAATALGTPDDVRVTATGFVAGTPAYMAPEQACGIVDARSDQFALCVALGEALTQRRPVADDAPVIAGRPALSAVLARGLRVEPEERFPTMGELADALAAAIAPPPTPPIVPARPRTGLIAAGATGVIAVAGLAVWLLRPDAATCQAQGIPGDLLPPARRASLGRVLPDTVLPRVDTWLTGWSAAAKDVCAVDRDDATLRARRDRCLADALGELRSLVERWEGGTGRDPLAALGAAEELPTVSHCSHAAQLSVTDPTTAQAVQIAALRLRMQRAMATNPPSIDAVRGLVTEANALGDAPYAVELALALAGLETNNERARGVLRDAIALADARHSELAQILPRIELVGQLGGDPDNESTKLADTARTLIAKLGGDPNLEGILDFYLGMVARARSQYDKAVALFERSVRQFHAAYGPDSLHEAQALVGLAGALGGLDPNGKAARDANDAAVAIYKRAHVTNFLPLLGTLGEIGRDPEGLVTQSQQALETAQKSQPDSTTVADAEYNLAAAYVIADHSEPALEHYQRAVVLNDKLGVKSDRQASALSQIAAILLEFGRPRDAIPVAKRAAAMSEEISDDSGLASSLTNLGAALLDLHDPRGALDPLQRALAIRDRLHEPARLRGKTRFLLATALWPTDRPRARDLAHAARVDIQSFIDEIPADDPSKAFLRKDQEKQLAKIDHWLASHR
jgi:eukaryotic-like serine/threonine-protein kinase